MNKITKEQLAVELAKLRQSHEGWVSGDERRRKEFAKAFNWWKRQTAYDYGDRDPLLPSWEQIFTEVGKIIAAQAFHNLEGNVYELKCELEEFKKKVNPDEK